jgi:hypothetical protein
MFLELPDVFLLCKANIIVGKSRSIPSNAFNLSEQFYENKVCEEI